MKPYILTIDQGTTSSRSLIYSPTENKIIAVEQIDFKQYFPADGWVEHELEEIWSSTLMTARKVIEKSNSLDQIVAIGITNQRETTAIWDEAGKPVYPKAIVWQDRRTTERCQVLKQAGYENMVREKTGLFLDPYFCSTKIEWIINQVPNGQSLMEQGKLRFGTIDGFLLWRLTGGNHAIDTTNASRTGIFNIHTRDWDNELLNLYHIHSSILPEVKPSNSHFGMAKSEWFGKEIPILGMVGDQQSSLFGHLGFSKGNVKSTYGTGAFLLVNTGDQSVQSQANLLTTIGIDVDLAGQRQTHYALEGSIFTAGALLKWLNEGLGIISDYEELNQINLTQPDHDQDKLTLIPAFNGLGAPHWIPEARGMLLGLTRNSDRKAILRAALESLALQTYDLLTSVKQDGIELTRFKVDGGVSKNQELLQFMSNLLDLPILRPKSVETTALGSALMASLGYGIFTSLEDIEKKISQIEGQSQDFIPATLEGKTELIARWEKAVACVKFFAQS